MMPPLILALVAAGDTPKPTFTVAISPEARVAVERTGPSPALRPCGDTVEIPLEIRNEAGLRRPLTIASPSPLLRIEPQPPLNGLPVERAVIRLRLLGAGPVDAEFHFDAGPGTGDVAWRSLGHLVLACTPVSAPGRIP